MTTALLLARIYIRANIIWHRSQITCGRKIFNAILIGKINFEK